MEQPINTISNQTSRKVLKAKRHTSNNNNAVASPIRHSMPSSSPKIIVPQPIHPQIPNHPRFTANSAFSPTHKSVNRNLEIEADFSGLSLQTHNQNNNNNDDYHQLNIERLKHSNEHKAIQEFLNSATAHLKIINSSIQDKNMNNNEEKDSSPNISGEFVDTHQSMKNLETELVQLLQNTQAELAKLNQLNQKVQLLDDQVNQLTATTATISKMNIEQLQELNRQLKNSIGRVEQEIEKKLEQQKEEKQCIICMENERNVVCIPCGHLSICSACIGEEGKLRSCPMCMANINHLQRVYI